MRKKSVEALQNLLCFLSKQQIKNRNFVGKEVFIIKIAQFSLYTLHSAIQKFVVNCSPKSGRFNELRILK
jgi:hypothetical protein